MPIIPLEEDATLRRMDQKNNTTKTLMCTTLLCPLLSVLALTTATATATAVEVTIY